MWGIQIDQDRYELGTDTHDVLHSNSFTTICMACYLQSKYLPAGKAQQIRLLFVSSYFSCTRSGLHSTYFTNCSIPKHYLSSPQKATRSLKTGNSPLSQAFLFLQDCLMCVTESISVPDGIIITFLHYHKAQEISYYLPHASQTLSQTIMRSQNSINCENQSPFKLQLFLHS